MASHRGARCWVVRPDSANVAILQSNRQTYALEGGALCRFMLCEDCDLDSLPFAHSLRRPSDFGWSLLRGPRPEWTA